ncbi:prepilin-type N-terminal cleavage/methylation domain-containing protein [Dethiosulfovibrio salsuginis]|uniref:Prepilin-type N-terminal cleavage/methylation domain-containing protein n=1 Tax=Dethiosulfovibrio salsuginis TaxID=561720 RepID=A0A1X7I173_9BACT|nr:prepilin-type N-terminal cleavage/methylation domain-containing protein [Dethiosulfovibrio salsuginis]SMG08090.1 prepilin-type N-terminal cleavage/methylation domain-containing protein [Dethiosulfovibrio salsuginis]
MTYWPKTGSKRRKAFTLVEVLIALMITSVIGGSTVSLLYTYLKNYEQSSEYTTALQRGQMVLSYLEPVALSAGLGFPSSPDLYTHVVNGDPLLSSWGSPLSLADNGRTIRIVYSTVLEAVTADMVDFSPGGTTSVALTGNTDGLNLNYAYGPSDSKWLSFLSTGTPSLTGSSASPLSLSFLGRDPVTSARFDPLLLVRTMEAYVQNDEFCVKDNNGAAQPVVKGVLKIYFEELEGNVLKVSVLTRGDAREGLSSPQEAIPWPDGGNPITADDYRYKLVLSSAVWRVRNL